MRGKHMTSHYNDFKKLVYLSRIIFLNKNGAPLKDNELDKDKLLHLKKTIEELLIKVKVLLK